MISSTVHCRCRSPPAFVRSTMVHRLGVVVAAGIAAAQSPRRVRRPAHASSGRKEGRTLARVVAAGPAQRRRRPSRLQGAQERQPDAPASGASPRARARGARASPAGPRAGARDRALGRRPPRLDGLVRRDRAALLRPRRRAHRLRLPGLDAHPPPQGPLARPAPPRVAPAASRRPRPTPTPRAKGGRARRAGASSSTSRRARRCCGPCRPR